MFRPIITAVGISAIGAASVFMTPSPAQAAQVNAPLERALHNYVDAFDFDALNKEARTEVRHIIEHKRASHADKVFALVALLDENDALRHVDMHAPAALPPGYLAASYE